MLLACVEKNSRLLGYWLLTNVLVLFNKPENSYCHYLLIQGINANIFIFIVLLKSERDLLQMLVWPSLLSLDGCITELEMVSKIQGCKNKVLVLVLILKTPKMFWSSFSPSDVSEIFTTFHLRTRKISVNLSENRKENDKRSLDGGLPWPQNPTAPTNHHHVLQAGLGSRSVP